MKFLFVCSGNTCRSPMAEGIMLSMCESLNIRGISAASAGVRAYEGERASMDAVWAASKYGADLTGHRARRFTSALARDAIVLCMTDRLLADVLKIAPEANAHALGDYAGEPGDIPDPFMRGHVAYNDCAARLRELILKIINNGGKHA